jgi:general secretion pathway protein D
MSDPHIGNRSNRCVISICAVLVLALALGAPVHAQEVTLNLKNADISALIETVAEITGRNFIVDPRVKGNVTVVSSTPMDDREIYTIFLQILKVHGFAAVDRGSAVQVILSQDAKTDSRFSANSKGGGIVTRVISVENVNAAQLVPVLRPLVNSAGHLAASPASNVLVITDRAENVEQIIKIIDRIDVTQGSEIEVIPLQHASATDVVRVVSGLIVQPTGAEALIARPKLMADERTNSVVIRADSASIQRLKAAIEKLDIEKVRGGNTHVISLRHARAVDLVDVLKGIVQSRSGDAEAEQTSTGIKTTIQADPSVNALIITAAPDVLASLSDVIEQLDVRRRQVLVEALIAEVSADKIAELGIQWRSTSDPNGDTGLFGGTNFNLTNQGINQLSANPAGVGDGLSLGFLDKTVSVLGADVLNLGALIRALGADAGTNILSTPSLVTLDNEEASIVVGQNVPFVTGQFSATGANEGASNPFQTIRREDVGITLRVQPQINEGDTIRLEISQEVSSISLATTSANASDIITDKRSINTTVLVDNKQIVILGGLMEDDIQENHQRVPFLGDIPLLGRLFRYERTETMKTNLVVFLTPTILKDSADHVRVSSAKYNQIRELQAERHAGGVQLMPDEEQPLLD